MNSKQKLQRDRAYFKFIVSGLVKPIPLNNLTSDEKANWQIIIDARQRILDLYDDNSKQLGLNIPEHRCWCGKAAKIEVDYYGTGEYQWVCNKHKNL